MKLGRWEIYLHSWAGLKVFDNGFTFNSVFHWAFCSGFVTVIYKKYPKGADGYLTYLDF